jgi:hypothetical protein
MADFLYFFDKLTSEMPAEPAEPDVKTISLELVTDESPRRKPWRPTTLTIRKFLRICHLVEKGWAISRACEAECITYSRFRQRVSQSPRLQERLKAAEETRFNLRHEQALEIIMEAGQRSWMAAGWWLERNLPARYALRQVNRDTDDIEAQPLLNKISMEQLVENAKLAAEIAASPPPGLAPKQLQSDTSEVV